MCLGPYVCGASIATPPRSTKSCLPRQCWSPGNRRGYQPRQASLSCRSWGFQQHGASSPRRSTATASSLLVGSVCRRSLASRCSRASCTSPIGGPLALQRPRLPRPGQGTHDRGQQRSVPSRFLGPGHPAKRRRTNVVREPSGSMTPGSRRPCRRPSPGTAAGIRQSLPDRKPARRSL